jgi:hypothetical protein
VLYPQLLQRDFENLPRALRHFHSAPGGGTASGTVDVRRVSGWLARLVGFPPSGDGIPLWLQVVPKGNQEVWIRRFGETVLQTLQRREGDLLLETFGPVRVFFRIFADHTGMRFQSQRARLWMFPVPLRIQAQTWGTDSSWEFQVTVACVGSYRGVVVPAA